MSLPMDHHENAIRTKRDRIQSHQKTQSPEPHDNCRVYVICTSLVQAEVVRQHLLDAGLDTTVIALLKV